ncbi:Zinc finger, C3HC4 type (RING finger) protein [Rhizoctonia solani]|uniref:Zinc finger, C3HC4 type (RING finger) protein n=1 Tax=Rhizoctonia solani TaxID=456999 RepID=A0A8H8NV51_9AGAM|nr:Zinc finger, C3HC4 type (RING finger) protein [Rhizoctonia solani]QRW18908.1 Zinc finger, C3HC4 type (RING finger) protein [Rhizoctonia solani]
MGRASLRAMPLAHLKAYLNAYGLRAPPHAVEKEDYVRAVLDARQNNGCLPKANEDYYRRHSIPQPTGERPKGFLARMAESFSDFVDSLPQPELSTHVHPPPVPPRHTAPRPPPPPPPRPQAAPSPSNARPTPQQPQHNPPPPPPSTQRPAPQAVPMEELLAMNSEEISALSIGKLKAILQHHHVRIPQDALEKRDLVDRVVTLVEAARVAKEREARLKAAEEEAELEAQRQALEEIDRRKKASVQKDDAGTSEERESQVDAPVGLPKAAAHAATKLERDGLCVICQDEDANIAIVDCGHLCLCLECSELVMQSSKECPLCRTRIVTSQRLLRIFKT